MKRTIIAVISIVLIAFAFTACRQSVVIPYDPTPSNPNTPSGPSVPDDTIQVGDKTYKFLEDAIAEAAAGSTIEIGAGEYRVASAIPVSKDIKIVGAGMDDKTIIKVNGNTAFNITGSSATISNLTIQDTADPSARKLINIESSKIVIDSVRFEGLYTDGDIRYYGIVTNADVSDITIKNSVFKGFKIPVLLDFDNVENPKATISGNTFDTFNKLSFSNYNDSIIISSDNEFVNPTNKEYQIELFKGDSLTAEQAVSVAKNTGLVVKAELEDGVYYNFDAEGFVISNLEDLKSFASGSAGSVAKLIAPITVTEEITFSNKANDLTLNGNGNGNEITVDIAGSTSSSPAVAFHVYGSSVTFDDVDISVDTGCINVIVPYSTGFTYDGGTITGVVNGSEWHVNMGIAPAAGSSGTIIKNATFIKNSSPVYAESADFTLDNVGFENGIEIANYTSGITKITDCYEIDGTEYPAALNLHGDLSAEKAMEISAQNNNCLVSTNAWNEKAITYNKDGIVVDSGEELTKAFVASIAIDEKINVTIAKPITIESTGLVIGQGNGINVVAAEGTEVTINGTVNLTSVTDVEFDGIAFNVGSSAKPAFIVNTSSDVAFVNNCIFTKDGNTPSDVAISVNGDAGNITVADCVFNNFVTAIYSDLSRGKIIGNTINGYGGIYILSNNSIANDATEPINYPDLKVSGNKAGYDISSYDHTATDTAWDNTLRFAVTDATTELSDAVKKFASDLKTANPDMNVAVIYEGEYPNIPVLWANNEDYSQGE